MHTILAAPRHVLLAKQYRHWLLPIFVYLLLTAPSMALATTYEWTDNNGTIHFTDNPDKVPPQYQRSVIRRDTSPSVTPEKPKPAPSKASPTAVQASEAIQQYCGETGASWRERYAVIRGEIKQLEDSLPELRKEQQIKHTKLLRSLEDGRPKTKKELEKLEKQQKGKGKHSPIGVYGNPIKNRQEYVAITNKIKAAEKRLIELQQQLVDLETDAGRCGVPFEYRQ